MIPNRIRSSVATTTALAYGLLGWVIAFETGSASAGRWIGFGAAYAVGLVVGVARCWPRRGER